MAEKDNNSENDTKSEPGGNQDGQPPLSIAEENGNNNKALPRFTVDIQSKVYKREAQKTKVQMSSTRHSVFVIFVALFFWAALVASLTATKLTLVAIGQQFNVSCTEPSCIIERENETPYIMMILIMMIPQFISFLRAVGNSAFSSKPWPSCRQTIWVGR